MNRQSIEKISNFKIKTSNILLLLSLFFYLPGFLWADEYNNALRRARSEDKETVIYFFTKY